MANKTSPWLKRPLGYPLGYICEKINIEVVREILKILGKDEDLITYVKDRLGHDRRYAIDSRKIKKA